MNQPPEPTGTIRHQHAATEAEVLAIFCTISNRQGSPLAIEGAPNLAFPFESLGRLLRASPHIGQGILQLSLKGFMRDTDSAVRLMDFVCCHFPNLNLFNYSYTEMCPLDYLLTQMARLPYLTSAELAIQEDELNAELVQRHQPFVRLRTLILQNAQVNIDTFAVFLPELFPNLVHLNVRSESDRFKDELLARVRVLFPRLTSMLVVCLQRENGEVVGENNEIYEF